MPDGRALRRRSRRSSAPSRRASPPALRASGVVATQVTGGRRTRSRNGCASVCCSRGALAVFGLHLRHRLLQRLGNRLRAEALEFRRLPPPLEEIVARQQIAERVLHAPCTVCSRRRPRTARRPESIRPDRASARDSGCGSAVRLATRPRCTMCKWATGPASGPRIGASFAKYASARRGIANSSAASLIAVERRVLPQERARRLQRPAMVSHSWLATPDAPGKDRTSKNPRMPRGLLPYAMRRTSVRRRLGDEQAGILARVQLVPHVLRPLVAVEQRAQDHREEPQRNRDQARDCAVRTAASRAPRGWCRRP